MKLVANMRTYYRLFNFLKRSSKISESSDRYTLEMEIDNSGMLTYSKMLTWSKRSQIVNIKRQISFMDPIQKYHWKALCYQFQLIYDAEIKNCWLVEWSFKIFINKFKQFYRNIKYWTLKWNNRFDSSASCITGR